MKREFKIDLHCHSSFSRNNKNIFQKIFGVNESYDDPEIVYRTARKRGMDAVTLCDHDTIDGALILKEKHPDRCFISEEISAVFPSDGFIAHVVALDIDPVDHERIQPLKSDIRRLVDYLRSKDIVHYLAHPSFGPKFPPQPSHIEQFMVLFGLWEFLNASRPYVHRPFLQELAAAYDMDKGKELARKYGLPLPAHSKIRGVAGSDAHTSKDLCNAYTAVWGVSDYRAFLKKLSLGQGELRGQSLSVEGFSCTIYDTIRKHFSFGRDRLRRSMPASVSSVMPKIGFKSVASFTRRNRRRMTVDDFKSCVDDEVKSFLGSVVKRLAKGKEIDVLDHILVPAVRTAFRVGPYGYAAYHNFSQQEHVKRLREIMLGRSRASSTKVLLAADMIGDDNGIRTRVKEMLSASDGIVDFKAVTCGGKGMPDLTVLEPMCTLSVPRYSGLKLHVPRFTDIVELIETGGFDVVHVMTPGPVGLEVLLAARLAGLPAVASYHTDVGSYISYYSPVDIYAEFYSKYEGWFFGRFDRVFALSRSAARTLCAEGVDEKRTCIMGTGVNSDVFNPAARDMSWRAQFAASDESLVLYAGRLVREKNVSLLVDIFESIASTNMKVKFLIVGQGNMRSYLEDRFKKGVVSGRVCFLPWLSHYDMPKVFASSDVFVFPSDTETFGNVVLEAMSCGLPVVVSSKGACRELVDASGGGVVCRAGDVVHFSRSVGLLLSDGVLREVTGRRARSYAVSCTWRAAVEGLADYYRELTHGFEIHKVEGTAQRKVVSIVDKVRPA